MNFEKVLHQITRLEEGDVLSIPCTGFPQAERIRGRLYRARIRMKQYNPALWDAIEISRKQHKGDFCIEIRVTTTIDTATITRKGGETEKVQISSDPPELTAILTAMEEDGLSKADREEYAEGYRREHENENNS